MYFRDCEFHRPVGSGLTDADWMARIHRRELPDALEWTRSFRAPPREGGGGLPAYRPVVEKPR